MNERNHNAHHEALKALIEKVVMRKVAVKRDYEFLSMHIFDRTGAYVSPITLRRFWGELAEGKYKVNPRVYTLNVLARYVGYSDYASFEKEHADGSLVNSGFLFNNYIVPNSLNVGACLHISWNPGHFIVVEYVGYEVFKVRESFKSKLEPGNTFEVDAITQNEPLYLKRLIQGDKPPCRYVCGQEGGVRFKLLSAQEELTAENT